MANDPKIFVYDAAGNIVLLVDARASIEAETGLLKRIMPVVARAGRGVNAEMYAILRSSGPLVRLRFFNPDWSSEPLCGNALRSAASYLLGGGGERVEATVVTDTGPMIVFVDGSCAGARIPVNVLKFGWLERDRIIEVGTPHRVRFTEDLGSPSVMALGRRWSTGSGAINATFVRAEPDEIEARTFERGVGETRSCGTGAIAAALAVAVLEASSGPWQRRVRFSSGERLFVEFLPASCAIELSGRIRRLQHET